MLSDPLIRLLSEPRETGEGHGWHPTTGEQPQHLCDRGATRMLRAGGGDQMP
jgi:hypothetical protein